MRMSVNQSVKKDRQHMKGSPVQFDEIVYKRRKRDRLLQWLERTLLCQQREQVVEPLKPPAVDVVVSRIPSRHPTSDPLLLLCKQEDPRCTLLLKSPPIIKIGQGRSGAVFRVPGEQVAIKEIKVPLRPLQRNRLISEVTALKELNVIGHENVMKLEDVYIFSSGADKKIWLVCEDARHTDLMPIISRLRLSEPQISVILRQVLTGLSFVHQSGWLHRDIKSDNLFVLESGRIVIGDFGAAIRCQQEEGCPSKGCVLAGTPHWLAPEVVATKTWNALADVWAAGIVLHEMIVGEPPFWHLDKEDAVKRIASFSLQDLTGIRGSDVMKDLLFKLLSPINDRISVEEALWHPFIEIYRNQPETIILSAIDKLNRI